MKILQNKTHNTILVAFFGAVFILLNVYFSPAIANIVTFGAKIIGSKGEYMMISGNNALIRSVSDLQKPSILLQKQKSYTVLENATTFSDEIFFSQYDYKIAKDGIYELDNDSIIEVQLGAVRKILKKPDNFLLQYDEVFEDKDTICKLLKFHFIDKTFVKKIKFPFQKYQLILANYPGLILIITAKYKDIVPQDLQNKQNQNATIALWSDAKHDAGCVPIENLTLLTEEESSGVNYLKIDDLKLLRATDLTKEKPFITINGSWAIITTPDKNATSKQTLKREPKLPNKQIT